jgi:glucokinase
MENNPTLLDDLVLALDFGGTKLAAAVVNLATEKIVSPIIRRPTPALEGANGSLRAMIACGKQAIDACTQPSSVKAVGISFGGPVSGDRRRVLLSHHVADWNGVPLIEEISKAFKLPAAMDNDANVAALGQWWFGGYRHLDNFAYIQISTGVGGGFVLNRQLYRGSGQAAELGHAIVERDGPLCSCGRKGCLESVCSGWAIARDGNNLLEGHLAGRQTLIQLSQNRPEGIDARLVFEACRAGDTACSEILQRALNTLAIFTVNLITIIDPQAIVLGGGLTRSIDIFDKYFFPVVQEQMHSLFKGRCQVELSRLDGDELLLGAALLTLEKIQTNPF